VADRLYTDLISVNLAYTVLLQYSEVQCMWYTLGVCYQ